MPSRQDISRLFAESSSFPAVLSADGDHLGSLTDIIENRKTGRPAYAVIGCGHQSDLRKSEQSVAWGMLKFDSELGAYVSQLSSRQFARQIEKPALLCRESQASQILRHPNETRCGMWV